MDNRGFTLIELVGTVVILAIIALLAFPAVIGMLNNGQKNVDESVKSVLESAAEEYVNDHIDSYPNDGTISTCKLVKEGYVSTSFYEKNKKYIDGSSIKVEYDNNYKYTYMTEGGNSDCIS